MNDLNTFDGLLNAVRNLGISVSAKTREFIKDLNDGILIDNDSSIIETSQGIFDIAPNGDVLKISIFINQRNARRHPSQDGIQKWHRFHLFRCSTIDNYPVSRKYRYKKTNNDQGLFQYIITYNNTEYKPEERKRGRKLQLCKNCQKELPYQFRQFPVSDFPIRDFFKHIPKPNISGTFEYDRDQVPIFYSHDWDKIARKLKEERNWICEQCYLNLSMDRSYLHAHHMDGNPGNNSVANIKALCIYCHSEQELHSHIKRLPEYNAFMRKYKQ